MKTIEEGLEPFSGHLLALKRDTLNGWYYLEIGIPKDWIFNDNDFIECENIQKSDEGVMLKIAPKEEGIIVDDLFAFVMLIIQTNSKISKMENEFTDQMAHVKKDLEDQYKDFYKQLQDLREQSFNNFNVDIPSPPPPPEGRKIVEGEQPDPPPTKKRGRPKKKVT